MKPPKAFWLHLTAFVAGYLVLFAIGCVLWALAVWASIWGLHRVGLPLP